MKKEKIDNKERSYSKKLVLRCTREKMFQALSSKKGITGWWTHLVKGVFAENKKIRLEFEGLSEHIDLQIDSQKRPEQVIWTCLVHSSNPEWAKTKIIFALSEKSKSACELSFQHQGLSPQLDCYDDCRLGWDYFLKSLAGFVERGEGMPFTS